MSYSETTELRELPAVVDLIPDSWFDVDEIRFDVERAVLCIKFEKEIADQAHTLRRTGIFKKWEMPVVEAFLCIHHVISYTINDTEQVGLYDFNELGYDEASKSIRIATGIPIDINVVVEAFKVSVEVTDKVVKIKRGTSIFS